MKKEATVEKCEECGATHNLDSNGERMRGCKHKPAGNFYQGLCKHYWKTGTGHCVECGKQTK